MAITNVHKSSKIKLHESLSFSSKKCAKKKSDLFSAQKLKEKYFLQVNISE